MKILIDCSNLQVGGGIQVATSFINDLVKIDVKINFVIILSAQMKNEFRRQEFDHRFTFIDITHDEQISILKRRSILKAAEQKYLPQKVFCVFGPSYYKSQLSQTVGYAIPHYIYNESPYFELLSLKERLRLFFLKKIQLFLFKKNSNQLIFETEDARDKFLDKNSFVTSDTFVVNNALNEIFYRKSHWSKMQLDIPKGQLSFLCLSANYAHKNLKIIPQVIDELISKHSFVNFRFYISVSKKEVGFSDEYDPFIIYLGRVPLAQVPSLYQQMDILFFPTLLEVFSTTYLEAMYMGLPIVTTSMSFAKDILGSAASYYSPTNAQAAADKLMTLSNNQIEYEKLKQAGFERMKMFGTSMDRTKKYLKIICGE